MFEEVLGIVASLIKVNFEETDGGQNDKELSARDMADTIWGNWLESVGIM